MMNDRSIPRRRFLQGAILTSAAFAAAPRQASAAVTKPESDNLHGLKLGMTTYTLRKFTLDQAIQMTKDAGVKYISIKDIHLPLKSTPEERKAARKKIEDAGLILTGGGVIYFKNDEAEVRKAFEYARDTGMPVIVCSMDPAAMDTVEKMVKEFDIRIAIHNHGPGDKNFPSALDAWKAVKDRDQRMGLCIDVGHVVRNGEDPVPIIKQCASRLYDFHMKDVNKPEASGHGVPVGLGVIDIVAVLRALMEIKYQGSVSLEYEVNENAPVPGINESYGYIRGVLAGTP